MGRRAKPAKAVEAKSTVARESSKNEGARVRDLEKRLAETLEREAVAQEQRAATAEILRVISSSPTDIQFVFNTIVCAPQPGCAMPSTRILSSPMGMNSCSEPTTARSANPYKMRATPFGGR